MAVGSNLPLLYYNIYFSFHNVNFCNIIVMSSSVFVTLLYVRSLVRPIVALCRP